MAKVIIGIHGLDNKPSKAILEDWWKQAITEGLTAIGKTLPLPQFELIYWADLVYDKPLSAEITDPNNTYYLDEVYTKAPSIRFVKKHFFHQPIITFINKQLKKLLLKDDLGLKHQSLIEPLIREYFREIDIYYSKPGIENNNAKIAAQKQIAERVLNVLKKYDNHDIFLIGHSMGSILGFDAISSNILKFRIHTFVTIGSPLGIPYVISKIARNQNSTQKIQTPASIKNKWYNFSDIEDIVAFNPNLSNEFIENERGVKPFDVLVTNDYSNNGKRNPHKSFGYLRTKEFAEALAAFIEEKKPNMFQKSYGWIRGVLLKKR